MTDWWPKPYKKILWGEAEVDTAAQVKHFGPSRCSLGTVKAIFCDVFHISICGGAMKIACLAWCPERTLSRRRAQELLLHWSMQGASSPLFPRHVGEGACVFAPPAGGTQALSVQGNLVRLRHSDLRVKVWRVQAQSSPCMCALWIPVYTRKSCDRILRKWSWCRVALSRAPVRPLHLLLVIARAVVPKSWARECVRR